MKNPYKVLGIILSIAGAVLAPVFYFFFIGAAYSRCPFRRYNWISQFLLANSRPNISPEACQILLKTGMENTAALLKKSESETKRFIYLPE